MHIFTTQQRLVHHGNGFFTDIFKGDLFRGGVKAIGRQISTYGRKALSSGIEKYKPQIMNYSNSLINAGRNYASDRLQELPGVIESVIRDKAGPEITKFVKSKTQNAVDQGIVKLSKVKNPINDEVLGKIQSKINRGSNDIIGSTVDSSTGKPIPNISAALKKDLDVIRAVPQKEFTPPSEEKGSEKPFNVSEFLQGSGSKKKTKKKEKGKGMYLTGTTGKSGAGMYLTGTNKRGSGIARI